ncbi:MAG: metal ABC transporter ATP-binding protein [Candidatus Riflebacteria bacterium]|nr:metal ABC transporter ATP-binding protein [Candidatus Riflebacteria bacterium]
MSSSAAVVLENVGVTRNGIKILYDVRGTIERGEVTAIIGPNGAGKTTLLSAILGHLPFTGTIRFLDSAGMPSTPKLAYVPQSLDFDRGSPITVLDFLALDRQKLPTWLGINSSVREEAVIALARLEAAHLLDRPLGRLSGGEIQRVLLASALRRNPELLLLDEPVSGVDVAGGHLFCDVLEEIRQERRLTLVMVSHDLSVVSEHATRVICLNRTVTCQGETPEVLTPENLFQIYGLHSGLYEHHPAPTVQPCDHHHHGSQDDKNPPHG